MFSITPHRKRVLGWLVFVAGTGFGFFEFANFAISPIPTYEDPAYRLVDWLSITGIGVLAVSFIFGSILALHNRKIGALIFLLSMPLATFCLTSPNTSFLLWHAYGNGVNGIFDTPLTATGIGLTAAFFTPLLFAVLLWERKKWAAYPLVASGIVTLIVFGRSQWTSVFIRMQAERCSPFLFFGLFWLVTHRSGWPVLRPAPPQSIPARVAAGVRIFICFVCFGLIATFVQTGLESYLNVGDCGRHPLFSKPLFPNQAVFTARTIVVGRSLNTFQWKSLWPSNIKPWQLGVWTVAKVERRLWGMPWSHFVLLTNGVFWRGEPYFIDGRRPDGVLTRFLPIIEVGRCTRSRPLFDADLEFRVLREGEPLNGARIMGHAEHLPSNSEYVERPTNHHLSGVRVSLIGPSGTVTTTTDQDGIYEFDGVQPAVYRIQAESGTETTHSPPLRKEQITPQSTVEVELIFGLGH